MSSSTVERKSRRTARHDDGITPSGSGAVNPKLGEIQPDRLGEAPASPEALSLMEAWLAVRGLSVLGIARVSGISDQTIYNLIESPGRARHATLAAIAAAMTSASRQPVTAEQVAALAHRKVLDPDRVSDEIRDALTGG